MTTRPAGVIILIGAASAAMTGTVAGQSECGGTASERTATVSYLMSTETDSTHGPVAEVKYADFINYGPGLLIAVTDSALTVADSVSQEAAGRPVAEYALGHMVQPQACSIIIVGWRRQVTRNSHFTFHVPFPVAELLP